MSTIITILAIAAGIVVVIGILTAWIDRDGT